MPPESPSSGNVQVIASLLAELDALGITEYCVAAGARNAPLLSVLMARAEAHDLTLRHFFEERCASFFALGRVMALRRPVAVVTTSGTAVAELYPAVMEAYYQGVPLVVVTADRPSAYRGSGAPQAVEQQGIFGKYVIRTVELELRPDGVFYHADNGSTRTGPMHFNVCLEEDLVEEVPTGPPAAPPYPALEGLTSSEAQAWDEFWACAGDLVVLAAGIHPADVPAAVQFLSHLEAPIVAEATANLLGEPALQPWLLPASERTLQQRNPQRVLRLGSVPSWRWWRDLEDREEVKVLGVSQAPFRGLARTKGVSHVTWRALELAASPHSGKEITLNVATASTLTAVLTAHPHSEPAWMRHLSQLIEAQATVFLGNSLPIREWNLAAGVPQPGTQFFANRGANGIDGLVSTWLGLGAEAAESWLIVGDLSTLYDLSAPWILPQLAPARRRIVIINNGGGKIFSRVAWLKSAGPEARKVMENSHALSFAPWAQMWGLGYRLITDVAQLQERDDAPGCTVWEVRPDEAQTAAFWRDWQGAQ